MSILLISKTPIIKQIFNLVSSKLDIDLTILDVNIVSCEFDIIIIEDILLDDKFPIQNYAKRFGIISKDKIAFDGKSDFLLSKPFLPSVLMNTIEEQINLLKTPVDTTEEEISIDEIKNSEEFINTLAKEVSSDILEESDESVVPIAFVNEGGVLDSNELSKIQDMLSDDEFITNDTQTTNSSLDDEDDWIDLSDIIDKAIDEVREYNFAKKEPIRLILNNYSMNELSALFNKLDQNIIDALVSGEEITLKLKVEK